MEVWVDGEVNSGGKEQGGGGVEAWRGRVEK